MNTKQTYHAGSGMRAACRSGLSCGSQDQGQESVADAARKARAEKKTAPKAKMTIDNDNLGTLTGTVNVVGEAPAPPEDADQESCRGDKAQRKLPRRR